MNPKNTHQHANFFSLCRRMQRVMCAAFALTILIGPVEASTWKPTALVNTEAFQSIDDTDTAANVVLKFGDTLAKTITYNRSTTRFEFNDNVYVAGNLGTSGSLSGASLYGLGLTNCSNATTSKLLYDSATGRFSCGTDQSGGGGPSSFGSGNVLSIGNQKYVSKQGDTMTGALTITVQNGVMGTVGAKIINTLSGASLHAEKTLSSSGTLVWEGAASGSSVFISGAASFGGPLTFGNAISDVATVNASTWTFANNTNFVLNGGVNGLSFDTSTFSVDALNKRIGINTTAPKTRLEVAGTISGALLRASNMTISGAVVYSSGNSLRQNAKGMSGQLLIAQGTAAPKWANPSGGMVWFLDGTQRVGTSLGASVTMPFGLNITGVTMTAVSAPTGTALIADIKSNGVSVFSTKPQINANATSGGTGAVLSQTIIPVNALVTLDINQIGGTFAGGGLTVILRGTRLY